MLDTDGGRIREVHTIRAKGLWTTDCKFVDSSSGHSQVSLSLAIGHPQVVVAIGGVHE